MLRRLGFGLGAALTTVAFVQGACGGAVQNDLFGDAGGDGTSGMDVAYGDGPSDATTGDVGNPDGPSSDAPGDTGDAAETGPCPVHCSADLHQILDCNDNVVQTCMSNAGCDPKGTCVPACQSAVANQSHVGCEFYAVDYDILLNQGYEGSCYAAFVVNTWNAPVTISVDRAGQTFNTPDFARIPQGSGMSLSYGSLVNGQLPAGQVAILFLSAAPTAKALCPTGITPAMSTDAAVHGTALGDAFHVTMSAPVVMYDMLPYGGGSADTSGASLLYPTSGWGTNYVVMDAFPNSMLAAAQPSTNIVALADSTKVTIKPVAAILGGGGGDAGGLVAPAAQNTPTTYTLSKGQVLQVTQDQELSGSPIQSDKPVGVWGGHACADIPTNACCCDDAHQQLPPVGSVGGEYVAVKYRDRDVNMPETPPWRMVGMVDSTTLTYDPAAPAGAPTMLMQGQVAEFSAGMPFVVSSQDAKHPFLMSAHMTGGQQYGGAGDPEFVQVVPPAQYLRDYVFFTDPTFPETNLVYVRAKTGGVFKDVKLDCAGTLSGWQPVGNGGKYQYTLVDLSRNNFQAQGSCDNGRHETSSDGAFELTVWGWGTTATQVMTTYVSYAYPGGAGLSTLNPVVVPAQ
jgi:hypothetical protein